MSARSNHREPDDTVQLTEEQIASARKHAIESARAQGLGDYITHQPTLNLIADLLNSARRSAAIDPQHQEKADDDQ